ncbi:rhamnulokinase [Rhodococcus sp. JS3073]|uniref:rhamnulokinase n=1 Tax=Rhodococcus sp. JS3073 TaxID=3002901 RepID=UPI0022856992|nr:rhamnulokinase family protein [Rhodococcus sp. JS3073]WAM18174.1 rhamnulokinase [Rhodococcus sp. JS3073]
MDAFAAIDLGASSGRVMLGRVADGVITLDEVARFPNRPVRLGGSLHWDLAGLYRGVLDGLRAAATEAEARGDVLVSIGIDTWAVDYGLLGGDGSLLGMPYHYRDQRTWGVAADVRSSIPDRELFERNGIAQLPFNTVYQLLAERESGAQRLDVAEQMLMIPDLLAYWLSGVRVGEVTNASTTGLLDPVSRDWDRALVTRLGLDDRVLPPLADPGAAIGPVRPDVAEEIGAKDRPPTVVAVGSHDTASAVVAVPAASTRFAYIASGTWSLVGTELPGPVRTEDVQAAGFTNEAGVDGTTRLLRNVMGMWLVQESMRQWQADGLEVSLPDLLEDAEALTDLGSVVDPDLPVFLPPGDMPARIAAECARTGQRVPDGPAEVIRCVMDSLADAYRRSVQSLVELTGTPIDVVHVVGGGSQNALLCQLTADATGLPVVAGPVEGSALGNVLVQARAAGVLSGGLAELRAVVSNSFTLREFAPSAASLSRA